MRYLLLLFPLLMSAAPPVSSPASAQAAEPPSTDNSIGQTQDLNFRVDTTGRMTVPVTIGSHGPYRFLVDTGAERTVISRQLATQLGFGAGARTNMQSVIGLSSVETVDIPDIRVSTRSISVAGAPALESEHIGADGMLGVDSLASQQVLLDFKRGVMGISASRRFEEVTEPNTIIVTARRRHGRLLFTNASINGRGVVVVIDTGSQLTVGNAALWRSLAGRGPVRQGELVTVAGEKGMANIVTVPSIKIGGLTIQTVDIAFLNAPVFRQLELDGRPAILLGMNVLRAFDRVSIDFANRQVRFVLPSTSMTRETRLASR